MKDMIKDSFGIQAPLNPEKYLRLPVMVEKGKKYAFRGLKSIIETKLKRWSKRILSIGGNEVFLKIVIQAMPTYMMSCFLLSKSFPNEVNSLISNYWWQHGKDKRSLHWIS